MRRQLIQLINREYTDQAIKRQTLYPGFIADGFIFLPSQVGITELLIHAYDPHNRKSISLRMRITESP